MPAVCSRACVCMCVWVCGPCFLLLDRGETDALPTAIGAVWHRLGPRTKLGPAGVPGAAPARLALQ